MPGRPERWGSGGHIGAPSPKVGFDALAGLIERRARRWTS